MEISDRRAATRRRVSQTNTSAALNGAAKSSLRCTLARATERATCGTINLTKPIGSAKATALPESSVAAKSAAAEMRAGCAPRLGADPPDLQNHKPSPDLEKR